MRWSDFLGHAKINLMLPILEKLLKRHGVKSLEELRPDEKQTFDKWSKILSEGEMTLDKVLSFCDSQISLIDQKLANLDNSAEKVGKLVIYRIVYKSIRDAITSPQAERESLEKYLNGLLNQ